MFFNDVYNRNEFLAESVECDQFNVELYAEEMTGELTDAYEIIMESDAEYYNLQEKMMKLEHCAIVTENAALLEEGKEGFGASILEKFKKMWEKVKAFFVKVKEWFMNMVQNDKKFLAKHGDKLKKATNTVEFEYGIRGEIAAKTVSRVDAMFSDITKAVNEFEGKDIAKDTIKNRAAKMLGFASEGEMKSELEKGAKAGAGKVSGAALHKIISDFAKEKAELDKLERSTDKFFKSLIADLKSNAKYDADMRKANGEDKEKSNTGKKVKVANIYANVITKYIGIHANILKARKNAARSAAGRLLGKAADQTEAKEEKTEEIVEESFNFGQYNNVLDLF